MCIRDSFKLAYVPAAVFEHDTYEGADAFKPLQFHGSTRANLMLRMKYGGMRDLVGIPGMLSELARAARANGEWAGFRRNMLGLASRAPAYLLSKLFRKSIDVPFNRWDYGLRRDGVFEPVAAVSEQPLVSIVVRTYAGRAAVLEQALCSIANQTYANVEAVVVEDKDDGLRAVADFAHEFGEHFHRIEAVAKVGGKMKVLDLKDRDTRSAIRAWEGSVEGLYSEPAARAYV